MCTKKDMSVGFLTILLIDDNPDDRELARRVIEDQMRDVNIIDVFEKSELYNHLERKDYDIVITDYKLNWSNGLEIVRCMKEKTPDVPIIMLTDSGNEEITAKAFRTGINEYIVKNNKTYDRLPEKILQVVEETRISMAERLREDDKKNLYALLRHNIRNKATVVRGYIGLLEDTELTIEQSELFLKIKSALQDCENLINKVHLLSRVEYTEDIADINIDKIVEQSVSFYETEAESRVINIVHRPGGARVLTGYLLKEAVSNLMENAIKHSGGTKIVVTTGNKGDNIFVKVEDDGSGVPDSISDKIFEKGVKGSSTKGYGLGTYIAKCIVERYDGSIEYKISPELGGACFEILLPNFDLKQV